ncbi:MAG: ABC transporter substrate-binding protein [Burkholderiales bacterium]
MRVAASGCSCGKQKGTWMNRRDVVLALVSLCAAPQPGTAQTARQVRRIGFLIRANAAVTAAWLAAFRAGLLELNWVEGRDYIIDARYAEGVAQAMPRLAAEMVALRPDLLVTTGDDVVRVLAQATKTIPIVFAIGEDPVGSGSAASLRRPGGNATGLTGLATELSAKRLQLLKFAFPRVAHVALLFEPDAAGSASQAQEIIGAAKVLGMRVTPFELRQPTDFEPAIKRGVADGAQAYLVAQGGTANSRRQEIIDRLIGLKVPAMLPNGQWVEAGGLMSYSASFTDNFRRAAAYADKILKGAKPGDLPIEQPTKFELVVNMKTAKAIGVTLPEAFMVRVDRVIE